MLWAITTYFNPCRYQSRRRTFDIFQENLKRQGVPLLVIECAFGTDEFELPQANNVLQVRCQDVTWQKERLLNLAASYLPDSCTSVAWLDCDVVFENDYWHYAAHELLQSYKVIQPWTRCDRLDKDDNSIGDIVTSFSAIAPGDLGTLSSGRYDSHGHTGYAWAAQRSVFDNVGLYEHAVTGSADHFMAHAAFSVYGFCIETAVKTEFFQLSHLKEWGNRFHAEVNGSVLALSGTIKHIWHGNLINRKYYSRMHDVTDLCYNPYTDIIDVPGRPFEWNPDMNKPELKAYFYNYFKNRREDDNF